MARLLDWHGTQLTPASVRSIECSLYERDADGQRSCVAAPGRIAINVCDVIFAALQKDDAWVVDDIGYNFRHRLTPNNVNAPCGRRPKRYEIEYAVAQMTGETTRIRFQIREVKR